MKTSTITPEDLIHLHNQGLLPEDWIQSYMSAYTVNPVGDAQEAQRVNRERVLIQEFIFWCTPILLIGWLWILATLPSCKTLVESWGIWAMLVPSLLLVAVMLYLRFVQFPLVQPDHALRFCEALTHSCEYVELSIPCFLESPDSLRLALLPFSTRQKTPCKPKGDDLVWFQMLGFFRKAF